MAALLGRGHGGHQDRLSPIGSGGDEDIRHVVALPALRTRSPPRTFLDEDLVAGVHVHNQMDIRHLRQCNLRANVQTDGRLFFMTLLF